MNGIARRVRPMGQAELDCWAGHTDQPQPSAEDRTAATRAVDHWGFCGVLAGATDRPSGALLVGIGPAGAPATGQVRHSVVTGLWVRTTDRGQGLGRHLVQAVAAELLKRDVLTLDAVARGDELPVGFLLAAGFRLVQPHPTAPRFRMDLTTTVRRRPDLAAAWHRITGLVPASIPPPQPAGFEPARRSERLPTAS